MARDERTSRFPCSITFGKEKFIDFWERKFIATSFIDKPRQQIEITAAAEMPVTIKPFAIPK
jgi:hypothetical protein